MIEISGEATQAGPKLTEVIDCLIAGGGPAGTAVAFRGYELGLRVLVVEYDDLMKRIRDYSKSKHILPGFGGGDRLKFPKGGALIDALQFGPIDKDAMCLSWKALYEKSAIAKRVGFELTGLTRRSDGCYQVIGWNHILREEQVLLARHVVLALGNGVPRRLDVHGDTDGISFRLRDPNLYVGEPACVIGGGTSAAEAVIAISNAKVAAGDASAVYWSYRGDRLPRVSKAMAEVFFEAYVGNGNIRYFPKSEPAGVMNHGDQGEYLSIRVDRRTMGDRPAETTHLEFPKKQCLACIGEDLPEQLLNSFGISLVHGGPRHKKRVVVNRYLESCLPNVYMVGDLLSQAYLETDDFQGDPATFQEIKHRGNIKKALRDGVLVAEVIHQRLQGLTEISSQVADALDLIPASPMSSTINSTAKGGTLREHLPPIQVKNQPSAMLTELLPNGNIEADYPLNLQGSTEIGRRQGDIRFPGDPMMGNLHARITFQSGTFTLSNAGPNLDIFLVLPPGAKYALSHGDLLRVGAQFLLISRDADQAWVTHYNRNGEEVGKHLLASRPLILGRESPDLNLDPDDRSLSRRHLTLTLENGSVVAKDLKSANHSFLRLRKPTNLEHGDRFQVGTKLFELVISGADVRASVATQALPRKPVVTGAEGPSVRFEGVEGVFAVKPGQSLCDVAEANGIEIKAECHMGVCGSDPLEIISGRENLVDVADDGECETLEDICNLDPNKCRLACKARVQGPVVVRILQV